MEKIIVLGTGDATAIENFNTCFVLQDNDENYLLVDTGGGNGILKQLRRANIDITKIHNIFISHKHTDHLFGLIWIYRFIDLFMRKGIYEGDLHICLGIKNLVIWHTLENLGRDRKNRYMKEAKENFSGNVFVPNDLEMIDL